MSPSCSHYSQEVVARKGLLPGVVATADRLMRCGADPTWYPVVLTSLGACQWDPVPGTSGGPGADGSADPGPAEAPGSATAVGGGQASRAGAVDAGFADELLRDGEHDRAVTEYRRVLHELPDSCVEARAHATCGVARAYFRSGEYARAADWMAKRFPSCRETGSWEDAQRVLCGSLLQTGETNRIRELARTSPTPETGFYACLALAYERRWGAAASAFDSIAGGTRHADAARRNAETLRRAEAGAWRSPRVAGALAIVPGLGYLYSEHRHSAASALFMNALLIGASYQAFRASQESLGGFCSFLAVTWYSGNVYGSVLAARRHNDRLAEGYLDDLAEP